jgi:hypothetical protein
MFKATGHKRISVVMDTKLVAETAVPKELGKDFPAVTG